MLTVLDITTTCFLAVYLTFQRRVLYVFWRVFTYMQTHRLICQPFNRDAPVYAVSSDHVGLFF